MISWILNKYKEKLNNYRVNLSLAPDLTTLECNRKIGRMIYEKKPFFVGRIGWTEGNTLGRLVTEGSVPEKIKSTLHGVLGVFPVDDSELQIFSDLYLAALREIDVIGLMPAHYQGWLVKTNAPQALVADLHSIEPYFCEEPWSWGLRNSTVLVVHPFADSILKQYSSVRKELFKNPQMLPEFDLKIIKAPQTLSGSASEYPSWSKTLGALTQQVEQVNFDVAIIGCGAYGFPLGAAIKKMGKIALHLGGVSQLLFGIRGRRWMVEQPRYRAIITEAWCSPLESERPEEWKKIEGGCYW